MNDFIVIAQPLLARKPSVVLRTQNEELARAEAHRQVRVSLRDALVFNLNTFECVLALTDEPTEN